MDWKCKSCSKVNRGNPQYCSDCGASLSDSVPAWLRWIVKVLSLGKGLQWRITSIISHSAATLIIQQHPPSGQPSPIDIPAWWQGQSAPEVPVLPLYSPPSLRGSWRNNAENYGCANLPQHCQCHSLNLLPIERGKRPKTLSSPALPSTSFVSLSARSG